MIIDAILTGMTGRISNLNRVQPTPPVKREQTEQTTPQSLDNVSLSKEAIELYHSKSVKKSNETENANKDQQQNSTELTEEQQKEVQELKDRDKEVRAHEQAHMSAGAPYTSSPKYEYTTGPDNQKYATEGHVDVDTSKESTPEKTIEKAQTIKRSASAPSEPSSQDKKVAAQAAQMEKEARAEMAQEKADQKSGNKNPFGMAMYMQASKPSTGSLVNVSF